MVLIKLRTHSQNGFNSSEDLKNEFLEILVSK